MRELSAQERIFLKTNLPDDVSDGEVVSTSPRRTRSVSSPFNRISSVLSSMLRYLPLAIGIVTLVIAAVSTYLYIWGRDLFKISEVERMSKEGTLGLIEQTSGQGIEEVLSIFSIAPWVIFSVLVLGIVLMGLSMLLIGRKRKSG